MNRSQKLIGLFSFFQLCRLIVIGNCPFIVLPCFPSLGKCIIVQNTSCSKPLSKTSLLLFVRMQTKFIGAIHHSNILSYGIKTLWIIIRKNRQKKEWRGDSSPLQIGGILAKGIIKINNYLSVNVFLIKNTLEMFPLTVNPKCPNE